MKLALGAFHELSDETLAYVQQLGVRYVHVPGTPRLITGADGAAENSRWDYGQLLRLRYRLSSFGLELAALGLPDEQFRNILYGRDGREEDLANVRQSIQIAGAVGIPVITYSFSMVGVWGHWRGYRSGGGRGNAGIKSYDHRLVEKAPPHQGCPVSADQMWERLAYLLEGIIPTAESADVRLACHPHDPPAEVLCGEARILGTLEGLQRLIDTVPSDHNGLLFCQGTVAEMGVDVLAAIRQFAGQGKVFHVHFRNVRGSFPTFDEVFIDEGDVDMLEALRSYQACGYRWTLAPDHSPAMSGDTPWGHRGRGYAIGYMRGLLHAVTGRPDARR